MKVIDIRLIAKPDVDCLNKVLVTDPKKKLIKKMTKYIAEKKEWLEKLYIVSDLANKSIRTHTLSCSRSLTLMLSYLVPHPTPTLVFFLYQFLFLVLCLLLLLVLDF